MGRPCRSAVARQCRRHDCCAQHGHDVAGDLATVAEARPAAPTGSSVPGVRVGDGVDVDVARLGDDGLPDPGAQQRRQPAAATGTDQDLAGVLSAGEIEQALGRIVGHHGAEGAAKILCRSPQPCELVGRYAAQPVAAADVDREPLPARRAGRDPRGPPHHRLRLGSARESDDHPLAGGPGGVDAVVLAVALERLIDPIGQPEQGKFPKGGEVALPEVPRQRGVDLVGGIDVPVGHPPAQRLGTHVDEFDGVRGANHTIRNRLGLPDTRDGGHHVVEGLQMLDVDSGDHVDAGVEERLHVLPPLTRRRDRAAAGIVAGVRVGQLVHENDGGGPAEDGVHVEFTGLQAAVVDQAARYDLQVADLGDRLRPVVGLDQSDDHVGPPLGPPASLIEHGEGLADPGCRPEIDP